MRKIFAVAILTFTFIMELVFACGGLVAAQVTVPTTCSISPQRNPDGVGQQLQVLVSISPPPPTANDSFHYTVQITLPDGSSQIAGPYYINSSCSSYFYYQPAVVGNYSLLLRFAGQTFSSTNQTYASSQSLTTLTVQQQPVGTPSPPTSSSSPSPIASPRTEVIGVLSSDTTWTQANSPYALTGPVAVNSSVTLTIQPGVSVNLNGYYIQVNGTLMAIGTATNTIQLQNGLLRFTLVSNGWNDKAGTGCTIQNANCSGVTISAVNALKLDGDAIADSSVVVGGSSVLTNDTIYSAVTVGDYSTLMHDTLTNGIATGNNCTLAYSIIGSAGVSAGDACTIVGSSVHGGVSSGNLATVSNNTIQGSVTGGIITGNTISSGVIFGETLFGDPVSSYSIDVTGNVVSNNNIINGTIKATQTASNNVVVAGIYQGQFRVFGGYATPYEDTSAIIAEGSTNITGNTVTGGGTFTSYGLGSLGPGYYSDVPAIDLSNGGLATLTNNTIIGASGLAISGIAGSVTNNIIRGDVTATGNISNNNIIGSITTYGNSTEITGNSVEGHITVGTPTWNITSNTVQAITITGGLGYILDNSVTGGTVVNGTGISVTAASATIENNFISGNGTSVFLNGTSSSFGVTIVNATGIILNNTISGSGAGIILNNPTLLTIINYNNILSNNLSIVLSPGTANNINATLNWWGNTDVQAINQSIFDNKRDFNLGTVTFIPFLTSANTEAMPTMQPLTPPSPTPTITQTNAPTNSPTSTAASSPTLSTAPTSSNEQSSQPLATPTSETKSTPPTPAPTIPELTGLTILPVAAIIAAACLAYGLANRQSKRVKS